MKRMAIIVGILVIAAVALLTLLGRREAPLTYNPANETKISGTVQEVQEFYCPVTKDGGTHLVLDSDQGKMLIHVATTRFLRREKIAFATGDKVEVTGSPIASDALIAREITRGSDVYIVRDSDGKPAWER